MLQPEPPTPMIKSRCAAAGLSRLTWAAAPEDERLGRAVWTGLGSADPPPLSTGPYITASSSSSSTTHTLCAVPAGPVQLAPL